MTDDVLINAEHKLGRLTLNRPAALHALTEEMCLAMTEALLAWRRDPEVKIVLIDHAAGTRGFCSGGDIRFLADDAKGAGDAARRFFFNEYRLNHLLHEYEKPVVALIDGVTMGGGVGISVHGAYRIATERTTFAMPETGIGLFPDVGGGWFLPRLKDEIGIWLALTGARLKGADCLAAGVATHYVPSAELADVSRRIAEAAAAENSATALRAALEPYAKSAEPASVLTAESRAKIARAFAFDTVEEIIAALKADGSEWAQAQLAALAGKSPQTLKVGLRQLRAGGRMKTFADNMAMEFRVASRVIQLNDFQEGVRAVIVDKDNAPRWTPATLEAVMPQFLDSLFAPLPPDKEWTPLG